MRAAGARTTLRGGSLRRHSLTTACSKHMPKAQSKAQPKAQLKQGSPVKKVRICCCFHARRLPLPPSHQLLLLSIALTFFEAYHGFLLCVCVALRGRGRRSALAPRAIIECGDHVSGDIQYTVYN